MEERIRMRPQTARQPEDPFTEFCSLPEQQLCGLLNIPATNLSHLQRIELKTDLEQIPFHKFGSLCPYVRELKLSNSSLESTRSLGTDWKNLEILWLVQTNLQNIDGISAFPKLKELYCAFNNISSLSSLFFNETIQVLDIEGNQIEDFNEIESLQYCFSLFSLNLAGNPISKSPEYQQKVFKTIPNLKYLDDLEQNTEHAQENTEELDIILNSVRETSRIMKKSFADSRTKTEKNIFYEESSNLTEEVFTGNPIKAMRFRRKKLFEGNNFMSLIKEFKVPLSISEESEPKDLEIKKNFRIKSLKKDELHETR